MRARLLALALLPLLACTSSRVSLSGEVRYGASAEEDYTIGTQLLAENNWLDAQRFLEHVRTKYPFSKYAALAELRLADSRLKQERYAEAADAYQSFAQLRPTHDEADYAEYQAALASYLDAPSDMFFLPASHEKDDRAVRTAVERLEAFLKARPESKYRPDAEKLLAEAQGRLAAHEWYVAEFYFKREHWAGAAGRLERLIQLYPGSTYEPEALVQLAKSYLEQGESFRAQQTLQRLVARYPKHPRRNEAEALLAGLRK